MNNLYSTIIILISVLFIPTKDVSAENDIRFIFNDGFATSPGVGCSSTETPLIDAVFGNRRRVLRGDIASDHGTRRDLATRSEHCTDVCRGVAHGSCWKIGCRGARQVTTSINDGENGRNLQTCNAQIDTMNLQLDAVMEEVSSSCKQFLDGATRRSECFPDVEYGTIDGIRLWAINSTSQTAIIEKILPNTQTEICKSLRVNLESLNQPCVLGASFAMKGQFSSRSQFSSHPPYSLFGFYQGRFLGGNFPSTGTFNVSITPAQDPSKKKNFVFKVLDC